MMAGSTCVPILHNDKAAVQQDDKEAQKLIVEAYSAPFYL